MTPELLQTLHARMDKINEQIVKISKFASFKKIRASLSFTVESKIEGVPKREDVFLNFVTTEDIPPEFHVFMSVYIASLQYQRNAIWAEINNSDVEE